MRLFLYKYMRVADGLRVSVSQHVQFTDFGVRSQASKHHAGKYVCTGVPGTGFFVQDTDADAYTRFVNHCVKQNAHNYWKFLIGKEFSFEKEQKLINETLANVADVRSHYILEAYYNSLSIAKTESYMENVIVAIKKKIHHRPTKSTISPLSHFKSRQQMLSHDLKTSQYVIENMTSNKSLLPRYYELVEAFKESMRCRRIWHSVPESGKTRLNRVFWDLGIFDFILSDSGTPIMRDGNGLSYYLYPEFLIKAKSSVDFELYPLKNLHFVYRETTQESLIASVVTHEDFYGKPLGEVAIEELGLRWYFLHRRNAFVFVDAITKYIEQL